LRPEISAIMAQQHLVFAVLFLALALFIWDRLRYDMVALLALLSLALLGIIPPGEVFSGFGHPAVVTVAAVLVISQGLSNAGVIGAMARVVPRLGRGFAAQSAILVVATALLSGFINNVGALALLMPLAIQIAQTHERPPSKLLMPIAFASLLGGLITLIGTPPNIIIANFRAEEMNAPFRMFSFAPVGLGVAAAGLAFLLALGARFLPRREGQISEVDLFNVEEYVTELAIPQGSKAIGKTLKELFQDRDMEVLALGLVRDRRRVTMLDADERLRAGDILLVEADGDDLAELLKSNGMILAANLEQDDDQGGKTKIQELVLREAVVTNDSPVVGQTVRQLNLRHRHGINLVAISRQGERFTGRLKQLRFRAGDVLLLQGERNALLSRIKALGCLPLAGEALRLGRPSRILLAVSLFVAGVLCAALGLLTAQTAFTVVAAAMILTRILTLEEAYASINWPVIVLLGAMMPVGASLEDTGGAATVAEGLRQLSEQFPPRFALAAMIIVAMSLSNVINNAAAAVLMAPVSIALAKSLNVSPDPLLMAVAVGSSCAFLTPIGHQSNTLVMGPGGYRFGDYWKMGLPLSIVVAALALWIIPIFWPF
jgi:di/tricarboxylate transporter